MDVTILELHADGLEFSVGSGEDGIAVRADAAETTPSGGDGSSGRSWLAALVGLLFLAVLAVLVKKRLDGADEP